MLVADALVSEAFEDVEAPVEAAAEAEEVPVEAAVSACVSVPELAEEPVLLAV